MVPGVMCTLMVMTTMMLTNVGDRARKREGDLRNADLGAGLARPR